MAKSVTQKTREDRKADLRALLGGVAVERNQSASASQDIQDALGVLEGQPFEDLVSLVSKSVDDASQWKVTKDKNGVETVYLANDFGFTYLANRVNGYKVGVKVNICAKKA